MVIEDSRRIGAMFTAIGNCYHDRVVGHMVRLVGRYKPRVVDRRNAIARGTTLLEIVKCYGFFRRLIEAKGLGENIVFERALCAGVCGDAKQYKGEPAFHGIFFPVIDFRT